MGGGESPGAALLHLLSMSSVCKQWRSLASEVPPGSAIAFDCFENLFSNHSAVQKFRRCGRKEQVFHGAAKLLTGVCLGLCDCVSMCMPAVLAACVSVPVYAHAAGGEKGHLGLVVVMFT